MNSFLGGIGRSEGHKIAAVNQDPRPQNVRSSEQRPTRRQISRQPGNAKIRQSRRPIPLGIQQDIGWLEIPMDNPGVMRMLHCIRQRPNSGFPILPWRPSTSTRNADKRRAIHAGNHNEDTVQTLPRVPPD